MSEKKYNRVLLKISGEALAGEAKLGINDDVLKEISKNIKSVADLGVQVAIVVGGGNFVVDIISAVVLIGAVLVGTASKRTVENVAVKRRRFFCVLP